MLKIADNIIADADELKTRLIDEWAQFDQSIAVLGMILLNCIMILILIPCRKKYHDTDTYFKSLILDTLLILFVD